MEMPRNLKTLVLKPHLLDCLLYLEATAEVFVGACVPDWDWKAWLSYRLGLALARQCLQEAVREEVTQPAGAGEDLQLGCHSPETSPMPGWRVVWVPSPFPFPTHPHDAPPGMPFHNPLT